MATTGHTKVVLDLGCGAHKKPGAIGIDAAPAPGVDIVLDFERDALPFEDGSVDRIFSSHCLEHLRDPIPLFREMSRVRVEGGAVEIWVPFVFSNDAFMIDHVGLLSEEQFIQIGWKFPDHWEPKLGARWILDKLVYSVPSWTQRDLRVRGIDLDFAVRHLQNVVIELGVLLTVSRRSAEQVPYREPTRILAGTRDEATWVPLRETQLRLRAYRVAQQVVHKLRRRHLLGR